jgi:hypothetical protein
MTKKRKYQTIEKRQIIDESIIIPDISLQLAFCFLSLKELPLVAQCNKWWNRVVTEKFFFQMYRDDSFSTQRFDTFGFTFLCLSSFRHAVRKLSYPNNCFVSSNMRLISQFTQLSSLDIEISSLMNRDGNYDYHSTFMLFPTSLRILKLKIIQDVITLPSLLDAISSLKQIHELHIESEQELKLDFSFIYSLMNLEILNTDFKYDKITQKSMLTAIRSLPKIRELHAHHSLSSESILTWLRQLCAQPGAPSSLMIIPTLQKIGFNDQAECVQLLCQLPSFKSISYQCINRFSISDKLSPFIHQLYIEDYVFNDDEPIFSMVQLYDLTLFRCELPDQKLVSFFNTIGKQLICLEVLLISVNCHVLFSSLSNLNQMKKLKIGFESINHVAYAANLFQLHSCSLLQSLDIIIIQDVDDDELLCNQFKSTLSLPSLLIPSLKNVTVETDWNWDE